MKTNRERAVHFDPQRGWDLSLDTRVGHQVRQVERRDKRKEEKKPAS